MARGVVCRVLVPWAELLSSTTDISVAWSKAARQWTSTQGAHSCHCACRDLSKVLSHAALQICHCHLQSSVHWGDNPKRPWIINTLKFSGVTPEPGCTRWASMESTTFLKLSPIVISNLKSLNVTNTLGEGTRGEPFTRASQPGNLCPWSWTPALSHVGQGNSSSCTQKHWWAWSISSRNPKKGKERQR